MVNFSLFTTPIGDCGVAWRGDVVVATNLPEQTSTATANRLASRARATPGDPPADIRGAIASMTALLEGEKTDLGAIECDFDQFESFAAEVYRLARAIPAGETLTYGDIAIALGDVKLARAVGRALGSNPIPIIVPCHRVVGANGKMTGFSAYGGVDTKRQMLRIEGALAGETLDLFGDPPADG